MPKPPDEDLLDLADLLADAAIAAMTSQRSETFLQWLRNSLLNYAPPGSPLLRDQELQRAFSTALGRAIWNAMPLPRRGFLTEPIAEPGRNDTCPCGSGRKFKHCCSRAPSLGVFSPQVLWPYVLRALSGEAREAALRSPHLPREAVLQSAADDIERDDAEAAIALLEPMLADPVRHEDEIAAHALDLLCDAYDELKNGKRRKQALLERIAAGPSRSPLRSAAHQRLACVLMDRGQRDAAWASFRRAQQDDPDNPAIGLLEVQLLMSEGRNQEASARARFHLGRMRRRDDLDPSTLEFFESVASDPGRALSNVAFEIHDGAGRALADWLDRVAARPLPDCSIAPDEATEGPEAMADSLADRLRQMGVREPDIERAVVDLQRQIGELESEPRESGSDDERPEADSAPDFVVRSPASVATLGKQWKAVFPLDKPFSVNPLPWGDVDPWATDVEPRWSDFLRRHAEAFDSLDIVDDLATAAMMHPHSDQTAVVDRLQRPLVERGVAIVERALAATPSTSGTPRLRWAITSNRPALRALYRAHELAWRLGDNEEAMRRAEQLIALNPDDNHGLRCWLSGAYLKAADADACLRLIAAYPDDMSPELRFNSALALFRLGRARSATEALEKAHRESPKVTRFLLAKRIARPTLSDQGISLDGDDRGWVYREDMRATWASTPGALDWASRVLPAVR